MRQLHFFSAIAVLMLLLFTSCTKENLSETQTGEVYLSFNAKNEVGKKTSSPDYDAPHAIVVTIKDSKGGLVESKTSLQLFKFEGEFVTEALTLTSGSYTITEYYVIDEEKNIIYTAPKQDSQMSEWVDETLPINFTVNKNATTQLAPEVISTQGRNPEEFGYASFHLNIVKTVNFQISTFIYNLDKKGFELTTANVTVLSNSEAITQKNIAAETSIIAVPGNKDLYTIKVSKEGYKVFLATMTKTELSLYENKPLKVHLEEVEGPISFITDQTVQKTVSIYCGLYSADNPLTIDWGDGSPTEAVTGDKDNIHNYAKQGVYEIKISGDASNILNIAAQNSNIKEASLSSATNISEVVLSSNILETINVRNLTELESLWLNENKIKTLDLSLNEKLIVISATHNLLTEIIFPEKSRITGLTIDNNIISNIDISTLTKLRNFSFTDTGIKTLNTSTNWALESLNCSALNSLTIQNNPHLKYIWLYQNNFTQKEMNNFFEYLYLNAIENDVYGGLLEISGPFATGDAEFAGESLAAEFAWNIKRPSPFSTF